MNCLELFAGCGGAALGLRRADFESIACVEADKWAVATLEAAGFPAVRAWIGDGGPADLPVWSPPDVPVDLLWASPPCQPYSMAGKREGADDARDGWPATLAAIERVRPTWLIIENVVGAPVEEWAAAVALLGYTVSYRILDAADWGLPSHRRRIFLVGGPREYKWPVQTHYGPRYPFLLRCGKSPWNGWGPALGVRDAVAKMDQGAGMRERSGEPREIYEDEPLGAVRTSGDGGYVLLPGNGGNLPQPRESSEPAHTVTSSCPQYFHEVAPTVCGGHGDGSGGSRSRDKLEKLTGRRRLTPEESAILTGLQGHPIQGPKKYRYKQAGNAVAPAMAEALGRAIMEQA